jgi:hypothetical protein
VLDRELGRDVVFAYRSHSLGALGLWLAADAAKSSILRRGT